MSIDYREFSKIIYFQDKDCKLRFAISDIIKEFLKNNTKELYHINLIIRYIDISQIVREITYNNRDEYSLSHNLWKDLNTFEDNENVKFHFFNTC